MLYHEAKDGNKQTWNFIDMKSPLAYANFEMRLYIEENQNTEHNSIYLRNHFTSREGSKTSLCLLV